MDITPAVVAAEHDWVRNRAPRIVGLINQVRTQLGTEFDTDPGRVSEQQYREAVDTIFADGDVAVNVATLVRLLRDLDVEADYPGFVIDEFLGRELAGMLAGEQPLRLLGEATFHYADVQINDGETAGADDLDAALAAGFQTQLPGWPWRDAESPYSSA